MRDAAGAVLVAAVEGTALSGAEADFFRRVRPAGVTLFGRNVPPVQAELAALVRSLQASRGAGEPPLLIAIDQEGGRVARLKAPFPNLGPAMGLAGGGGAADAAALREVTTGATQMATALLALGINVNFAPVCDVLTEPSNTAIGDRAFATEALPAAQRAGAFLTGLQAGGVAGCLKHFPGQGAARVDTHLGAAVIELSPEVFEERELGPFKALLPQAPMVMISHCIYPHLDSVEASRSARIMQTLLRDELGYGGVIVSDDMNMGAIPQDPRPWQEAIVAAVAAGADMVLVCRHLERCELAYEALTAAAARSASFRTRLAEAASRVTALRRGLRE